MAKDSTEHSNYKILIYKGKFFRGPSVPHLSVFLFDWRFASIEIML